MSTSWQKMRLKFFAPSARKILPSRPQEMRYLGLENIESRTGKLLLDTEQEQVDSSVVAFDEHSVLFGKLRPYLAKVATPNFRGVASTEIMVLEPANNNNRQFLAYSLLSDEFIKRVSGMTDGAKMPRANPGDVLNLSLSVPPPFEQERIAAYLDEQTAKIDRLIDMRRRQMALLKEQRAAMIQQAVTRGLDPDVPMKDSGLPCLPEIPVTWSSTKLKYLGKVISGFAFGSADFTDTGIRVLKIANIQTMRLDWSDESFVPASFYERHSAFAVADGDLVFALTRPIISTGLKAAIADIQGERVLLNQRNAVFKPNTRVEREFLYCTVFSRYFVEDFESRIDATGQQPNISPIAVADISIALPPLSEQRAILKFVQHEASKFDLLYSAYARQLTVLAEYRAALIHECVTGQRAVPEVNNV